MSEPRVLTQPLGGPPLARAVAGDYAPEGWYRARPRGASEWQAYVDTVRKGFASNRWVEEVLPALAPTGEAARRLAQVADGAGIVVTTGQQTGLFGGPIYTWLKAYSAVALADELEAVTGRPVAAIFWASTDDSDFTEAATTHVAVRGGLETLSLPPPSDPGLSMRDTPLGDVSEPLRILARGAGAAAHPEVLDAARASYGSGETVGSAYVGLLRRLLEPLGVLVLDGGHPTLRSLAMPVLTAALRTARPIEDALRERDGAIRRAGYEPQVAGVDGLSVVFETRDGRRRRVPLAGAVATATRALAGALGPNVLLRPVLERSLLPTAAYVGGPGELAYFAQVSAVAEQLGVPVPLVLPRWSGIIIEPHIDRVLARLDVSVEDLRDPHAAEVRLARRQLPAPIAAGLERYRARLDAAAHELQEALNASPLPISRRVVEGSRRSIEHRVTRLEQRMLGAVKREEVKLMRDLATARAALFPLGRPQERMLNMLPLLARHGPRLVEAIIERAREHVRELVIGTRRQEDQVSRPEVGAPLQSSRTPP